MNGSTNIKNNMYTEKTIDIVDLYLRDGDSLRCAKNRAKGGKSATDKRRTYTVRALGSHKRIWGGLSVSVDRNQEICHYFTTTCIRHIGVREFHIEKRFAWLVATIGIPYLDLDVLYRFTSEAKET
jgi:hypothetical protein